MLFVESKKFPCITFDSISKDRRSDLLFRHNAQSMEGMVVFQKEEDKSLRGLSSSGFHNLSEIPGLIDSFPLWKAERTFHGGPQSQKINRFFAPLIVSPSFGRCGLNRQFFSSLQSPSPQNVSPAFGAHPLHKAVRPFPLDRTWLIGSFHRTPLYRIERLSLSILIL